MENQKDVLELPCKVPVVLSANGKTWTAYQVVYRRNSIHCPIFDTEELADNFLADLRNGIIRKR